MADKVLTPEDQQELMDKFDTVERELGLDVHQGFNKVATELERKAPKSIHPSRRDEKLLQAGAGKSLRRMPCAVCGVREMEDGSLKSRQTLDVSITKKVCATTEEHK